MRRDSDMKLLSELRPRVPRARSNIIDNLPGWPNGTGGRNGTDIEGGRTAALGIRHTMTNSVALADLQLLDSLNLDVLKRAHLAGFKITQQVGNLHTIVNRWDLTDVAVANLRATANAGADPGCRSCQRIGKWSEIHRNHLCRFCTRATPRVAAFYEWDDDMPPRGLVEWHHDTGKGNVTEKVIHQVMFGQKRRDETLDAAS